MGDLSKMVGMNQLEAAVSYVGHVFIPMNEDTYTPAIDNTRTDIIAMKRRQCPGNNSYSP